MPDKLFARYLEEFPEFAALPDQARWRARWRRALIRNPDTSPGLIGCVFMALGEKYDRLFTNRKIRRVPACAEDVDIQQPEDWEAFDLMRENLQYAMSGYLDAIWQFLRRANSSDIPVDPAIRHYFRLILNEHAESGPLNEWERYVYRSQTHMPKSTRDELTSDERAFIAEARSRGDWQVVLKSIDRCPGWPDADHI